MGLHKAVDSAGNEFEVEDRITFSIDGTDSTLQGLQLTGRLLMNTILFLIL